MKKLALSLAVVALAATITLGGCISVKKDTVVPAATSTTTVERTTAY